MGVKMHEFLQGPNEADQIVKNIKSSNYESPDWSLNLEICDRIKSGLISEVEIIRAVKKRIMMKQQPRVQYPALVLLEACVKNCQRGFVDVVAEGVLDEMVQVVDDPETVVNVRNRVLVLIEAWGESGELCYLPVYEVSYMSLKSRGIQFPGRDDESLAPVFNTFPYCPGRDIYTDALYPTSHEMPSIYSFTAEQIKEEFSVAHNTIKLLSTVLSSSPRTDILEDDLTSTLTQNSLMSKFRVKNPLNKCSDIIIKLGQ